MPYTKQETFDMVLEHLAKQGGPAVNEKGLRSCLYRGANGTKCAIGALIPDELYHQNVEGQSVRMLLDRDSAIGKYFNETFSGLELEAKICGGMYTFAGHLQAAHDGFCGAFSESFKGYMLQRLTPVAVAYGLNTDVLQRLFAEEVKNDTEANNT